jgi:hypothetical protein
MAMADTFMYFKKLEAAGFTRKQAEAQIEMVTDFSKKELATREDMKDLSTNLHQDMVEFKADIRQDMAKFKTEIREEMAAFKTEVRREIADLRQEMKDLATQLRHEMSRMEDRLTIRLGGMMIVGFGALAALIKLT